MFSPDWMTSIALRGRERRGNCNSVMRMLRITTRMLRIAPSGGTASNTKAGIPYNAVDFGRPTCSLVEQDKAPLLGEQRGFVLQRFDSTSVIVGTVILVVDVADALSLVLEPRAVSRP